VALNVVVGDVVLRPFRSPEADYAGMAAANQRTRDAAGIGEVITAESLARDYAYLVNSDLEHDLIVAERDGTIVGYCRVEWRDLENGKRTFAAVSLLDPTASDEATYRPMVAWAERRLADKARAIPVADRRPSAMRIYTFGAEVALMAVLESTGWTRTGHGYEMVRPTLDDIPEVVMPEGLVVRPVGLDEASRRPRRTSSNGWPTPTRTRPCGSSPSMATRSPAGSTARSTRPRTPTTVANGAASTASGPDGRGADGVLPGRSSPAVSSACATMA
jgi:hypothetical protein